MLPDILTEIVREAGGDHLLLDARNGRGIISDATQVEHVCRKLSNAGFTRMVNYTGMHVSVGDSPGGAGGSACDSDSGTTSLRGRRPQVSTGRDARSTQDSEPMGGATPTQESDEYALFLTIRHPEHNHSDLTLKWKWQRGTDAHPGLSNIWLAAGLAEREMFEMLGIPFSNNTQLTPLFLDETFGGHPLRLDFVDEPAPSYAEQLLKQRHEQGMIDAVGGADGSACDSPVGAKPCFAHGDSEDNRGRTKHGFAPTKNEDGLAQSAAPTQDGTGEGAE